MIFQDRHEAGRKLADKLEKYRNSDAVVFALPRGGVVLGYEVSRALSLPLDVVTTRKIGHPTSGEYAIGAVDENGTTLLDKTETASVDKAWLKEEIDVQKKEAERRSSLYRGKMPPRILTGKDVIVVDDGIATGYTMKLALMALRKRNPKKIVIAIPVAPTEAVSELAQEADEVIVLQDPKEFLGAIGMHYESFEQVDDDEVVNLLNLASSVKEMNFTQKKPA